LKAVYNGYIFVFMAILVFSTIEVGSQYLQKDMAISALDISILRFGIGGMFLIAVTWITTGRKRFLEIIKKDGLKLATLGLLGATGVALCFHRSLMLTSSMIGGAIFSINPAIVALIFVIFRVDKLVWQRLVGIILGIACVFVSNIGAKTHEPEFPRYFLGNIFMVGAVLAWSFYFYLVRDYIKKYSGLVVSSIMVTGGFIGLFLFAPFSPYLGWGKSLAFFGQLNALGWILAIYLGVVSVGLGYYWLYTGLAKTGVSNGMMIFFIKPPLVALLAHFIQGQSLSSWIYLGIILAAASILIVGIAGRKT
jgi:drug/metabolite transporter (DMT)-like permease